MSDDANKPKALPDTGHVDYFVVEDGDAACVEAQDRLRRTPPAPRTWADIRQQFRIPQDEQPVYKKKKLR